MIPRVMNHNEIGITHAPDAVEVIQRTPAADAVTIIGAGLGGLSAAIHLRLAGHEVTMFEANEKVGGRANVIEQQGYRFDTGPSLLNYPWVFRELFQAAGRRMEDYVTLLPVDPSVSFQWRDGTSFQLSSNLVNLGDECERLEPGARVGLWSFLQDAGFKYQLSFDKLISHNEDNPIKWLSGLSLKEIASLSLWRSLDGELKRFFKSRHIREALGAYGMYLGGSPFDLPGLFTILAYGELAYGLWLPKGGIYGLIEGIEQLALELGVNIHTRSAVSEIVIADGRVSGVRLADGAVHRSSIVISNVDVPTTNSKLLPSSAQSKAIRKQLKQYQMTPGVITFYWGIKGSIRNLKHHTIFLPDNYRASFDELFKQQRIPEDLPFYISVPSATDTSLAPAGDTTMFVLVPTPLLSEMPGIDWTATINSVKANVLGRMQQQGIAITPEQIVFEQVYTPETWSNRFGLFDGSAFGGAHTFFQVGPFRPRNYSAEIEGLYYTGASTTPGTGMPMVILSGKLVAERVLAKVSNATR